MGWAIRDPARPCSPIRSPVLLRRWVRSKCSRRGRLGGSAQVVREARVWVRRACCRWFGAASVECVAVVAGSTSQAVLQCVAVWIQKWYVSGPATRSVVLIEGIDEAMKSWLGRIVVVSLLAVGLPLIVGPAGPAQAAGERWYDGANRNSPDIVNCIVWNAGPGMGGRVGYYGNLNSATPTPSVGAPFYVHVVVAAVGNPCAGPARLGRPAPAVRCYPVRDRVGAGPLLRRRGGDARRSAPSRFCPPPTPRAGGTSGRPEGTGCS